MADLKISQLTETSTSGPGDFFIINKGNNTTNRINYADLVNGISGFNPIYHNFPGQYETSVSSWAGTAPDNNVQDAAYRDIFSGQTFTFTLPDGADRALVVWYYAASLKSLPNTAVPGGIYAQYGANIKFTGANVITDGGVEDNEISFGKWLVSYTEKTGEANPAAPPDRFKSQNQSAKMAVLSTSKGATITATRNGSLKRAKKCQTGCSAGRVVIIPFSSTSSFASEYSDVIVSASASYAEDLDPLDGSMAEKAIAESDVLKEEMKYVLEAGDLAIKYDTSLTANQIIVLEGYLSSVLALKSDTGDFDTIMSKLKTLEEQILGIIGFNFGFESTFRGPTIL